MIDSVDVELFLPDTIYNLFTIYHKSEVEGEAHGTAIEPIIYASDRGIMLSTEQYVSESVMYIGASAFENCISLKSIDLTHATGLTYVGVNAFAGSGLESIDLSKNTALAELNNSAFEGCTKLVSVTVCSALKTIGANCFKNDKALTSFVFSDSNGLVTVGKDAFYGCDSLTAVPSKA